MAKQVLQIQGMTCAACAIRVEKALAGVPGVESASVNLATNLATVSGGGVAELVDAVRNAGYDGSPVAEGAAAETLKKVAADESENLSRVRRRLIAGAIAGVPILVLDLFHIHAAWLSFTVAVVEFLLASVVVFYVGMPFFAGARRALRHGAANMDLLVALGSGVAYVYSVVLTAMTLLGYRNPMTSPLHSEYHAAVAIIVLVTLGKFLEARAKRAANNAVAQLATQVPTKARRLGEGDAVEEIDVGRIEVGDRIEVLAHQTLPVDGKLAAGVGALDLSVITGESAPVEIGRVSGDAENILPAGARLLDGRIVIRAAATAADSTISRILSLVQTAQAGKTQIQGFADRIAGIFVPIVIVLAFFTMMGWFFLSDQRGPARFAAAIVPAIATIVIACPCAMGLATPTAITVAVGVAARRGILFTRIGALERVGRIHTVAFDKTGTLTEGRPVVSTVGPFENAGMSVQDFLRLAASIEQFADHPLARAILAAAEKEKLELKMPVSFNSVPGGGVRATFDDGAEFAAGSAAFVYSLGVSNEYDNLIGGLSALGETVVVIADLKSKRILGLIGLKDTIRYDAFLTMRWLRKNNIRVAVLSGDTSAAVEGLLRGKDEVDVVRAGLKPEDKSAIIAELKKDGPVAFVGDGINDAPALASADLGIAMAAGTDLAKSAGDILLAGNRLGAIAEAATLSRKTLRIIKQNLFWAFAYNVASIPLAMLGILPPQVAAGAMILSSLTVVFNALRLYRTTAPV
jgi:Cu+-exporting ATPase